MEQVLKNIQMAVMRNQLQPLLSHRNKVGYVAARNYRILSNCLLEYEAIRLDLLKQYGEEYENEQGETSYRVKVSSPNFKPFCDELAKYNEIEQKVDIMTLKYEEAIGCLTGEEFLATDWMFED